MTSWYWVTSPSPAGTIPLILFAHADVCLTFPADLVWAHQNLIPDACTVITKVLLKVFTDVNISRNFYSSGDLCAFTQTPAKMHKVSKNKEIHFFCSPTPLNFLYCDYSFQSLSCQSMFNSELYNPLSYLYSILSNLLSLP